MIISYEIPQAVEHALRGTGPDVNQEAKEAYLVDLYRRERISHRQLAEALELSRYEVDGMLKRHKVSPNVTAEEMRAQVASLEKARPA